MAKERHVSIGRRVRVSEAAGLSRRMRSLVGIVKGVTTKGLVIVRWDGQKFDQFWHPDLLEHTSWRNRMTLVDRVVAHLRETRGEWELRGDGALRRGFLCPLSSYRSRGPIGPPEREIMKAADGYGRPNLRRRMLRAAGVVK